MKKPETRAGKIGEFVDLPQRGGTIRPLRRVIGNKTKFNCRDKNENCDYDRNRQHNRWPADSLTCDFDTVVFKSAYRRNKRESATNGKHHNKPDRHDCSRLLSKHGTRGATEICTWSSHAVRDRHSEAFQLSRRRTFTSVGRAQTQASRNMRLGPPQDSAQDKAAGRK